MEFSALLKGFFLNFWGLFFLILELLKSNSAKKKYSLLIFLLTMDVLKAEKKNVHHSRAVVRTILAQRKQWKLF